MGELSPLLKEDRRQLCRDEVGTLISASLLDKAMQHVVCDLLRTNPYFFLQDEEKNEQPLLVN